MIKIGHRGAAGYEPENTLRSFRKALELGVDMIELDVCICKSGELVVIHDDRVDRKTHDEIKTLDAEISLLEEVLDLTDRKAVVNIELKGENTALPVSRLIKRYVAERGWSYGDFLVSSFNRGELLEFRNICPEVRIGTNISGIPTGYAEFAEDIGAYSIHPSLKFVNKNLVNDAHRRGLKVFVWTVNDPDDIERMKGLCVDGIFSDYPDRLR